MTKIVRFCPSPTGFMHIGNARPAILNFLYAKQQGARYILRFDDTDVVRSKEEYKTQILKDLEWIGIKYDAVYHQSERLERYREVVELLKKAGRIYECFETQEELEFARKRALAEKKPPIYERTGLKFQAEGRASYYRFLLEDEAVVIQDGVFGEVKYNTKDFSDPVIIRANGDFLYLLCSVIDDYDFGVTDIIRGADHLSNTAVQIQMFKTLANVLGKVQYKLPNFAHFPIFTTKSGKISKRVGGFSIKDLHERGIEPLTVLNVISKIGRKDFETEVYGLNELVSEFSFAKFNTSTAVFDEDLINTLNAKLVSNYAYKDVKNRLDNKITEDFFESFKANLDIMGDIYKIYETIYGEFNFLDKLNEDDKNFIKTFGKLAENLNTNDWKILIDALKTTTERKGKSLFMPIRIALTGAEHGAEMATICKFLTPKTIMKRSGI